MCKLKEVSERQGFGLKKLAGSTGNSNSDVISSIEKALAALVTPQKGVHGRQDDPSLDKSL